MTFIIAEAGINHNGSLTLALEMVKAAKIAGADAIKFQSFTPDILAPEEGAYRDLLKKTWLSASDHGAIADRCRELGIEFMSTPFDQTCCDMLVKLGVKRLKISSGKVSDTPFVEYVVSKKLPVIVSTGMIEFADLLTISSLFRHSTLSILYCVSKYPTPEIDVRLGEMKRFRRAYRCPVGFSDHTEGIFTSVAAAAAGASIIEKHFTLNRHMPGPDHVCSLEPAEMTHMIREIRSL